MSSADQRHASAPADPPTDARNLGPSVPSRPGGPACLALDVGGSSVTGAVVGRDGRLCGVRERALDSGGPAADVVAALADELDRLRRCWARGEAGGVELDEVGPAEVEPAGEIVGVGFAVPGPFDEERGRFLIRGLHKFERLYGIELGPLLSEALPWLRELPLVFLNDASAFALGELGYGAARGARRATALTLGTGCGSAFLVDDELVTSGPGVPRDGHVYHLPFEGATVDDALSSRGIAALWTGASSLAQVDGAPSAAELASRARGGDQAAILAYHRFGARLARALGPTINAFAPDVVVLGGNIARAFDLFGGPAAAALDDEGISVRLTAAADIGGAALKGAASKVWGRGS